MSDLMDLIQSKLERAEAEGRQFGFKWAAEKAEASQLARLAAARDPVEGGWDFDADPARSAFGPHERFYFIIEPDDESRAAAANFWKRQPCQAHRHSSDDRAKQLLASAFVHGFALGAMDAWEE